MNFALLAVIGKLIEVSGIIWLAYLINNPPWKEIEWFGLKKKNYAVIVILIGILMTIPVYLMH